MQTVMIIYWLFPAQNCAQLWIPHWWCGFGPGSLNQGLFRPRDKVTLPAWSTPKWKIHSHYCEIGAFTQNPTFDKKYIEGIIGKLSVRASVVRFGLCGELGENWGMFCESKSYYSDLILFIWWTSLYLFSHDRQLSPALPVSQNPNSWSAQILITSGEKAVIDTVSGYILNKLLKCINTDWVKWTSVWIPVQPP